MTKGIIRVGRRIYNRDGTFTDPYYPGFTPIRVLTKSSEYSSLSPYCLKTKDGIIHENYYQFSKLYPFVPATEQYESRFKKKLIWSHTSEIHVDDTNEPNENYWKWREAGFSCEYPVRYPVGYKQRHLCLCSVIGTPKNYKKVDYITSRKEIYLKTYWDAVKKEKQFLELRERLLNGENLLIIEVDGPHQESVPYYHKTYGIDINSFIQNSTIIVNKKNMKILLNDTKHPFGHGYCLGMSLLHKVKKWQN